MANTKKTSTEKPETSAKENKVPLFIPDIEGEEPEVTIGYNGKHYKIRRGTEVMVPPGVHEIYMHSERQKAAARARQKELENQEFDW